MAPLIERIKQVFRVDSNKGILPNSESTHTTGGFAKIPDFIEVQMGVVTEG